MPPGLYARTLTEALSAPGTPPPGRPLFLSGSAHDTAAVYDTLEAGGWRVVGDDHDSGDSADQPPVAEPTLEGLAEHYTREVRPATARTARERAGAAAAGVKAGRAEAFLCYCRRHDDAHRWDFPAQRAAAPVPSALLHDQPYGEIDTTGLDTLSARPATEVAS